MHIQAFDWLIKVLWCPNIRKGVSENTGPAIYPSDSDHPEDKMEFTRQEGHIILPSLNGASSDLHLSKDNMDFCRQPFTNGISSGPDVLKNNMEVKPYGNLPVSPLKNGISPVSHASEDTIVFEDLQHSGIQEIQLTSPVTDGISLELPSREPLVAIQQESSTYIDERNLPETLGGVSSHHYTAEIPTNPPDSVGHWVWKDEKEKTILEPYDYIASEPGKELRTLLLSKFNVWLQVPEKSFNIIANVVRMLHTASLLIDDIQDGSQLRRGKPVAHRIYGVAQTINAGNYVYFQALQELYRLNNPEKAIEVYTTELLHLHRGQGMDLWWRDTLTCPTVEEYLEMASNKTGGLFRLAIRLMQVESPTSIDCIPLVELVGLIFQIVDDYKNLSDIDYSAKKGVCEDLTEGKFSFPVIHSIRANPKNSQLLHILAQKPTDFEVKKTAVQYIKSTGSFEYTKQYVEKLTIQARDVADSLDEGIGGSKGIHKLLDLISIR